METRNHFIIFYVVLFGVIMKGVSCMAINITPHSVVRPGDSKRVLCNAPHGTILKSCKFYVTGMPEIDLSRGRLTQGTSEYAYYGKDLTRGQCGIILYNVEADCPATSKIQTVTCAVQVEGRGWSVAYTSMLVTAKSTFELNVDEKMIETKVGANVSILCDSRGIALKRCLFQGRNLGSIDLSQGWSSPVGAAAGRVEYFGQGLEEGECGVRLIDVKEDWSGLVWCAAKSEDGSWGYDFTTLAVAKLPSSPTLSLSSTDLRLRETLSATCSVKSHRFAVSMKWEPPFEQKVKETFSENIADARLMFEETTISQEMKKTLVESDNMKKVKCTVMYEKYGINSVAEQPVKVRFCGTRKSNAAIPQAFHGTIAKQNEFPWHVALYNKEGDKRSYQCGGSIISTKHVLSAAHCVWKGQRAVDASSLAVAVKKVHREWEEDLFADRFNVTRLHIYHSYNHYDRLYENDIAILVLDGEVVFSDQVYPVCINWNITNDDSFFSQGNNATVPGWGTTEHHDLSDLLRHVDVPNMNKSECRNIVPREFRNLLTWDKFCAGYHNRNISTCVGDSGGGLIYSQNFNTPYYILGITSVAPRNPVVRGCYPQQITAYTNVTEYFTWIKDILNGDDPNHVKNTFL